MSSETVHDSKGRLRLLLLSLLLVLAGIADSVYLVDLHHRANTDASFNPACDLGGTFQCTAVAASPASVFLGVPVAAWSLVGYALFLFLLAGGLLRGRGALRPWPSGLYWLLSTATLAVTLILAGIAELRIHALCLGCLALYLINTLLFGAASRLLLRDRGALTRDLRGLRDNLPVLGAAGAALVVSGVLMGTYPPYWKTPIQAECDGLQTVIEGDGSCWIGARDPELVIIEFSDYRCPFCLRAHYTLRGLVKRNPERIRLVHKHFPLDMQCNPMVDRPFHEGACTMARMAYCASQQDRFWRMNDALFALPHDLNADPEAMAVQIGLDVESFAACMDSPEAAEQIRVDIREGLALEITGTPTFLVNGETYLGRIPDEILAPYRPPRSAGRGTPP